ncbi:hypothetical protein BAE44_0008387 [Dichanthelium oligosanthes]|uniref:Uncharacterized protein n=1 Tax=Dichanthelium oligosanthes TaxID=888268 RepID=A0A1E5VZP5_9POAL|nr:hypothetical protein BAE44_0008387 [Dichanthelium oligosanthes]
MDRAHARVAEGVEGRRADRRQGAVDPLRKEGPAIEGTAAPLVPIHRRRRPDTHVAGGSGAGGAEVSGVDGDQAVERCRGRHH